MTYARVGVVVLTTACLLSSCAHAPASQPELSPGSRPLATIALEPYLQAQSVVHATIAGQEGTFLFDTGEGVSSISPEFAGKIQCHPWGQLSGFRMSGERLDRPHCDQLRLDMAGESFVAPEVITFDIMKLLGPDVPHVDGALGLDVFAGRAITIVPRQAIVVESPASLARRAADGKELPIRVVRDAEGVALAVDGAVPTPQGMAWMELDSGNGGTLVIGNHIAPLLGLRSDLSTPAPVQFELANGIRVEGKARTRDLIMDGNIGAQFLDHWILTLDLERGRAWMAPMPVAPAGSTR